MFFVRQRHSFNSRLLLLFFNVRRSSANINVMGPHSDYSSYFTVYLCCDRAITSFTHIWFLFYLKEHIDVKEQKKEEKNLVMQMQTQLGPGSHAYV